MGNRTAELEATEDRARGRITPTTPWEWWLAEDAQAPEVNMQFSHTGGAPRVVMTYGDVDLGFEVRIDTQGTVYERHWQALDFWEISDYDPPVVGASLFQMTNALVDLDILNVPLSPEQVKQPMMHPSQRDPSPLELTHAFVDSLKGLDAVEAVLLDETDETLSFSVIVNNASKEQCYAIFDRELALLQRYPDSALDFHVIERRDQPLRDVVSVEFADLYVRV